jgi:hypothetical protein
VGVGLENGLKYGRYFLFSVRSTNVYEEQSLGIFKQEADEEETFEPSGPRITVWSRYLTMHARRQLAFG